MSKGKWIVVIGTYFLIVLGFFLSSKLKVDLSLSTLSSSNSQEYKNYQSYSKKFPVHDNGIVISMKSNSSFSKQSELEKIDRLCTDLTKLNGIIEVNSITTISIPEKWTFGGRNRKLLKLNSDEFEKTYSRLPGYRDVTPKFLSKDRKAARIYIVVENKEVSSDEINHAIDVYDFDEVHISGKDIFKTNLHEEISKDLTLLPIMAGLLMLILFFIWFQDLKSLLVIISILGLNVSLVGTVFWLTGIEIGILTVSVPSLIIVLSFCDIVHVIHRYKQQDSNQTVAERLIATTKPLRLSLLLTSMTTFTAFGLFFLSGIDEIVDFAIVTCSGIVIAYLSARFVLPTFLGLFRIDKFKRKEAFIRLSSWVIRLQKNHVKLALGSVVLVIILSIPAWQKVSINSSFHHQIGTESKLGQAMSFSDKYFDGARSIEVIISADDVLTPETILIVEDIETYLKKDYGCRSVFSVNSVIKRLNRYFNFNGTAGVWRKSCIADAGGWQADTLTEDLDLSFRAQIKGWIFFGSHSFLQGLLLSIWGFHSI